jgi:hypothetical protein
VRKFRVDLRGPGRKSITVDVLAETSSSALLWALHTHPEYSGSCSVYVRPVR